MANKPKSKGPGTNPGLAPKLKKESMAEQAKMRDQDRRPPKGGKLLKGIRRRAG